MIRNIKNGGAERLHRKNIQYTIYNFQSLTLEADPFEATALKTTRDLTKSPHGALEQIEIKQYETEMVAAGVKDILKLAIAFRGKELWVKRSGNC